MNSIFASQLITAVSRAVADMGTAHNTNLYSVVHGSDTYEQQNSKLGHARHMSQVLMLLNTFVVQFEEDKDTGMNLQDIVGNAIEFHGNSCTSKAQGRFKKIVEKAARESEKNVEKRPNYF